MTIAMQQADRFVDVAALSELREGEGKIVFVGIRRLALFLVGDEVFCVDNRCPHAGGFLGHGRQVGCRVWCPRHDWAFNLETGECETDPRYELKRFEVRLEEGRILVGVPEDF